MRRLLRPEIISVAIIVVTVFAFAHPAAAAEDGGEGIEELRQKIEQKSEEIKKLEEETKKYRDEIVYSQNRGKTLKAELARIDLAIRQFRGDIALTERKIEKTSYEIERVKIEIFSKETVIRKMRSGLTGLLQEISEGDGKPLFEVLIASPLSDFLGQLEYIALIKKKILVSLEALRSAKHELEVKKAEAESKNTDLKNLGSLLKDRKKIQEGTRKDRSGLVALTQNQEKRYQALLRDTEKKQEEVLREIEELENKLRTQVDPGSLPEKRKGFLTWPAEGILSQGYGETPFSKSNTLAKHFYKFHNGIDIASSLGTPVAAADDGRILAIGDTDRYCPGSAYGKYIVADHKNNLATMYAHLSLVKVGYGQEVKRGDIIGYAGSSGLSTGPHLHFTLYDSRTVEIKPGKTGACGPLPLGGSLNPLLYL